MDAAILNLQAVIDQLQLPSTLRAALDSAMDLASNSRAETTERVYAADASASAQRMASVQCRQSRQQSPPSLPTPAAICLSPPSRWASAVSSE
jgi:hypothetical protein